MLLLLRIDSCLLDVPPNVEEVSEEVVALDVEMYPGADACAEAVKPRL